MVKAIITLEIEEAEEIKALLQNPLPGIDPETEGDMRYYFDLLKEKINLAKGRVN